MMVHYGAPPFTPGPRPERLDPLPYVPPEDLARQLRELKEALDLLRQGKGDVTSLAMVRRVVESMIAGDPLALGEIERICAEHRQAEK